MNLVFAKLLVLAMVALALGAWREPVPEVDPPQRTGRKFTIHGKGLQITPGKASTRLLFTGGVECISEEMQLSADLLEVDVLSGEIVQGDDLRLPDVPGEGGHLVANPGETIKSMAAEMSMPSARFDEKAIQRVGAKGSVVVNLKEATLSTNELVSTDGGASWAASGGCTIRSCSNKETCYEISADYLLYNMVDEAALARGNITGKYSQAEDPNELTLHAERLELNLKENSIEVSEFLEVEYGPLKICCGELQAGTGAQDEASGNANPAGGTTIAFDMKSMSLTATGGVVIRNDEEGLTLVADQVEANLAGAAGGDQEESIVLVATGSPEIRQGENLFKGDMIRLEQWAKSGKKTQIEVFGQQHITLDMESLQAEPGGESNP